MATSKACGKCLFIFLVYGVRIDLFGSDVLYGLQFQPNSGSNFHHKVINPVIGLEDEEIIPVTKRVMEEVKAGKKYGY